MVVIEDWLQVRRNESVDETEKFVDAGIANLEAELELIESRIDEISSEYNTKIEEVAQADAARQEPLKIEAYRLDRNTSNSCKRINSS
jgi:hypothetical protein